MNTSPAALLIFEQTENAVLLRSQGKSYKEIAKSLNMTEAKCATLVHKYLNRRASKTEEVAEQVRSLERMRLDHLFDKVYHSVESPVIVDGKPLMDAEGKQVTKVDNESVRTCLSIMKRRSEMDGLDAVKKIEIEEKGNKDIDARLDAIVQKLRSGGTIRVESSREIQTTVATISEAGTNTPIPGRVVELPSPGGPRLGQDKERC